MECKYIVNADDFGMNENNDKLVMKLIEGGFINSISVMVNGAGYEKVKSELNILEKKVSVGLHFNVVDGYKPLSKCKSLCDKNGLFKKSNIQRLRSIVGLIKKDDIENELLAQINELQSTGVRVSHIDSHGHIHKYPVFLKSISNIYNKYKIEKRPVRPPQNIYTKNIKMVTKLINRFCTKNYKKLNFKGPDGFVAIDDGVMFYESLERSNCRIVEISVHPGENEEFRKKELNFIKEIDDRIMRNLLRRGYFHDFK